MLVNNSNITTTLYTGACQKIIGKHDINTNAWDIDKQEFYVFLTINAEERTIRKELDPQEALNFN